MTDKPSQATPITDEEIAENHDTHVWLLGSFLPGILKQSGGGSVRAPDFRTEERPVSVPALISAMKAKTAAKKARRKLKAKRLGTAKKSLSGLKKALWALLAPAIRNAYGPFCFTCGGNGNQTGHMFAKGRAHAISAWHPDNLRPQCFYCNINMGGNGAEFSRRYILAYGLPAFDYIAQAARTWHKWTPDEIAGLIAHIRIGLDNYREVYRARYDALIAHAHGISESKGEQP